MSYFDGFGFYNCNIQVAKGEQFMAKTVGTKRDVLKVLGIKIYEFYSDYVCNETVEDIETMRDDIILHEQSIHERERKNKGK